MYEQYQHAVTMKMEDHSKIELGAKENRRMMKHARRSPGCSIVAQTASRTLRY